MTGPVTPAAIAEVIRKPGVSVEEAANLIQAYADQYASGQVIKALEEQFSKTMAILDAPLTRIPS